MWNAKATAKYPAFLILCFSVCYTIPHVPSHFHHVPDPFALHIHSSIPVCMCPILKLFLFFDNSAGLCTNVHTIYITCSAQYPSRTWPNSKKFCNKIIFPPPGEYLLPTINSANAHWYAHSHMVSRLSTAKHLSTWRPVTNVNACHPLRPHHTPIGS